jgi:hypothetical protein
MIAPTDNGYTIGNEAIIANYTVGLDEYVLADIDTIPDHNALRCPYSRVASDMKVFAA